VFFWGSGGGAPKKTHKPRPLNTTKAQKTPDAPDSAAMAPLDTMHVPGSCMSAFSYSSAGTRLLCALFYFGGCWWERVEWSAPGRLGAASARRRLASNASKNT
jgi:hypothetical protein